MHFLVFLLLLPCVLSNKTVDNIKPVKFGLMGSLNSDETSSFRCGDTIKSSSGSIAYKAYETVQPNERCVWTIRSPSARSYVIYLTSIGIGNFVTITGLGVPSYTQHIVPSGPSTFTVNNSNVVVITFATGPINVTNNARGFALWYASSTAGFNANASSLSEDVILPPNHGLVKFPTKRSIYASDELSVIVFTPNGPTRNVDLSAANEVIYIQKQIEGGISSCYDWISVFVFDVNMPGSVKWRELEKICARTASEVIRNNDIIMLTFRSDYSFEYTGFQLYAHASSK